VGGIDELEHRIWRDRVRLRRLKEQQQGEGGGRGKECSDCVVGDFWHMAAIALCKTNCSFAHRVY
jgi:hypothetical protein